MPLLTGREELDVTEPESVEVSSDQQEESQAISATTDETVDESKQGPIPFKVHKTALDNARQKVREELEGQYGYLSGREQTEVLSALNLYDFYLKDPEGLATYLASQTPNLRQKFFQQPEQQKDDEYPKPVLDNYTGQYYYSKAQLDEIRKLDEKKYQQLLDQKLAPVQQKLTAWEQEQQQRAQANQDIEEYAATLPAFDELLDEIIKEMNKDKRLTVPGAWRRVYERDYLPKLKSGERENTMETLRKKAQANTETRPSKSADGESRTKYSASGAKRHFEKILADLDKQQNR